MLSLDAAKRKALRLTEAQRINLDAVLRVMSRKQIRSVFECTARINLWHGAVSSGKTIASLMALIFAIVKAPENGLIFICGRTLDTIERNVLEPLMQPFGPFGPLARFIRHTQGATTATIFGRKCYLVGASDALAEGRIRGATAALIYIDEATLVPEAFFKMCLSRLRVPGAKMLATTNPDGPMHWLRKQFMLRPELNMRSWHFTLDDNPSLEASYVADLKTEYVGLWYRRFILGEWCLAEGAIFDAWDPDFHVVTDAQMPRMIEWPGVGIDHGTVNPFAAELLGLGADGGLYVADEYYYDSKAKRKQLSDYEYAVATVKWLDGVQQPRTQIRGVRGRYTCVDPSAASFRVELHKHGITSVLANNDVMSGLRLVASLIATGRLRVHERCQGLINEIPGYSWDPDAALKGEDAPLKVDDHACDGTRYVVNTTEALWRNKLCAPVLL